MIASREAVGRHPTRHGSLLGMHGLLLMVASCSACAMHGTPARWSSFPVVVMLACVNVVRRAPLRGRPLSIDMRWMVAAMAFALGWSVVAAVFHFDVSGLVALVGGAGAAVLGFWIGYSEGGAPRTIELLLRGTAIGYCIHAGFLLSWFVSEVGWSVSGAIQFRWSPVGYVSAETVGFGNLGNNAVVAAMVLPWCVALAVRPGGWPWRTLGAAAGLLAVAVLIIVQSRAGVIAATLAVFVVLIAFRARILLLIATLLLAVIVVGLVRDDFWGDDVPVARWRQSLESPGSDASFDERALSVRQGWDAIWGVPAIGVGPANLAGALTHTAPHQWHLHQSLEWGIPAGVGWCLATVGLFTCALRHALSAGAGQERSRDVLLCLSLPATYILIGSVSGAQWHFGFASVWPTMCGLGVGAAVALEARPTPEVLRRRSCSIA
jgi:O-antigen ligase